MPIPLAPERQVVYTAEVVNQGGREGRASSENGGLEITLAPPAGDAEGKNGTNPEQLFAAAYGACFHAALMNHAEKGHVALNGSTLTARVTLYEDEKGGYTLGVELRASLPGLDRAKAEKLLREAHQTCPYSKAVRGNVEVRLTLD
jgi:Ohr subfamily peroxiredoxin